VHNGKGGEGDYWGLQDGKWGGEKVSTTGKTKLETKGPRKLPGKQHFRNLVAGGAGEKTQGGVMPGLISAQRKK